MSKTLEQRIADLQAENGKLVAANNTLTQEVVGKMGAINKALLEAETKVDSAIAEADSRVSNAISDFVNSHTETNISYYDGAVHSKTSLKIEAEPDAPHISKWLQVPVEANHHGHLFYPTGGRHTRANFTRCYASYGGYGETPEKYQKDWSITKMQFLVTHQEATSEEINAELARLNISLGKHGGWTYSTTAPQIKTLRMSGMHPYSRLFVRFINDVVPPVPSTKPLQNVVEFGGNAHFAVDRVINYINIKD